jgi:hypothetical protein
MEELDLKNLDSLVCVLRLLEPCLGIAITNDLIKIVMLLA